MECPGSNEREKVVKLEKNDPLGKGWPIKEERFNDKCKQINANRYVSTKIGENECKSSQRPSKERLSAGRMRVCRLDADDNLA